jgi:hypothetical protein
LPILHVASGHSDGSAHDPVPVHDTSQAHAFAHFVRRLHELGPVQSTSQRFALHWISSWHDDVPMHCTWHDVDIPQFTLCPHA